MINNSSINSVTDRKFLGYVAALVTVTIWAAFLVGTRFAVTTNFTVEEIMVLRLIPASIIMAPYMIKLGVMPPGNHLITKIIFALGASALFPSVLSIGLYYSTASNAGALGPGTLPFWTALIAFLIAGEKPKQSRKFGLFVILFGALVIGIMQFETTYGELTWLGNGLFLLGAALWAIYSVIFRQSGIAPLHGLVIGLFWGSLIFVPFLIAFGNVDFDNKTLYDITHMVILHSFIIGILAMLLFTYAVKKLGAAQTAAFGALTPILALIGGVILLDEIISLSKLFGICLVTAGVLFASGALSFTKK